MSLPLATITALPTAPQRSDPANFATRADAFVAALAGFRTEINSIVTDINGGLSNATILGTVSQSGGTPTGSILEKDGNANGDYVRLADGTQICTVIGATVEATDTAITWPASFAAADYAVAMVATAGSPRFSSITTRLGGSVVPRLWDTSVVRASGTADLIAIGRWY